jgi:hypothetical protein
MKMLMLVLLCGLWLLGVSSAQATCLTLTIKNVSVTQSYVGGAGAYSPFTATTYNQTVSFDVSGGAITVACSYFLTLSTGSSGNNAQRTLVLGGKSLNYNAYTDSTNTNILKDLTTATASQVITGSFGIGSGLTNHHTFSWTIAPQQITNSTTAPFSDTVTLTLYTGVLTVLPVQVATQTLTFQSTVDSDVDLALVSSGSAFNIASTLETVDFGNLVSGASQGFDLVIRSDSGYKVTLQSANKQNLLIQNAAYTDKVPYTMTIAGSSVDLSSGAAVSPVAVSGVTTAQTGVALPIVITLGTLSGHETSGTYQDIVTVSVSAD